MKDTLSVFFVILNSRHNRPSPLMMDEDDIAVYDTREAAEEAAKLHPLGEAFGYEVYEWNP